MSSRSEILRSIIDDPASTDLERAAARKELGECPISQDVQDRELDSYLSALTVSTARHRSSEHSAVRQNLSPASQQLLNDMSVTWLLVVQDAGTESRLHALLENTKSEIVKEHVLAALSTIEWLKNKRRVAHAT
jgi:hypothetical protein